MSSTLHDEPAAAVARPRVAGERELEILDAALHVLADVGYDRLTMDAVAAKAKASKATLYRRWAGKPDLVIEALCAGKGDHPVPDTGSLREDLIAAFCGGEACEGGPGAEARGGLADETMVRTLASVLTAVARDPEFAAAFRRDFIGPKVAVTTAVFDRARERGEVRADLDLDLIAPALPGIVMHRALLLGERPDREFVIRVIDQIVLPAVAVRPGPD